MTVLPSTAPDGAFYWRIEYNTVRSHSALGYLTPTDYAKVWTTTHSHSR